MACAWAGFAAYAVSMLLSYFIGQKYYPINYPVGEILLYVGIAIVLYAAISVSNSNLNMWAALSVNTILVLIFAAIVVKRDLPLRKRRKN